MNTPATSKLLVALTAAAGVIAAAAFSWRAEAAAPPSPDVPAASGHAGRAAPPAPGGESVRERVRPGAIARGYYTAPAGTELAFALRATQRSTVCLAAAGEPAAFEMVTVGEMHLTIAGRRGDEVLVSLSYPRWRVDVGGEVEADENLRELQRHMATPVQVRLGSDGAVLGWRFAATTPPSVRAATKGLFALARCVVSAPENAQWHTTEADPAGVYEVDYARLPDVGDRWAVRRTRSGLAPDEQGGDAMRAVVRDDSRFEFDPDLGWLVGAACRESVELASAGGELTIRASSELTLELIESRHGVATGEVDWGGAWAAPSALADSAADAAAEQRAEDEALVGGAAAADLLFDLRLTVDAYGIRSRELHDARERVKALLRVAPESLETVRQMVADRSLGEVGAGVALSAVGAVGSEPGQHFLAATLADRGVATQVRSYALYSLFQVGRPVAAVRERVLEVWNDPSASTQLRGTALLLLGSQARGSDARLRELVALAPVSNDERLLETYVEALGNAGRFEMVESYLGHPEGRVRRAADRVLGRRP